MVLHRIEFSALPDPDIPMVADFLAAAASYLELNSGEVNTKKLAILDWMDEKKAQELITELGAKLVAQLIQRIIAQLTHDQNLANKLTTISDTQAGFAFIAASAKKLIAERITQPHLESVTHFTTNPDAVDALITRHGLYTIKVGKTSFQLENIRITSYLKSQPAVFLYSSEQEIAQAIKEQLRTALEADIALLNQMADKALPVFSNETFNLIEIELHNPFQLIKRSLDYIKESVAIMNGSAQRELLFMNLTEKLVGTGTLLTSIKKGSRTAFEAFNYLVEHFWPYHVGRFVIHEPDVGQDEEWVALDKPDPIIDQEGPFPINKLVRASFNNQDECVALVALATLQTQVLERRKDYEAGESVSPLPRRPHEGYWVVVPTDIYRPNMVRKIHIPYHFIVDPTIPTTVFLDHYRAEFAQSPDVTGIETVAQVKLLLSENIHYGSPAHKINRANRSNGTDADLRIHPTYLHPNSKGVKPVLTNPAFSPLGSRTPTVLSLQVLPINQESISLQSLTELSSHRVTDGKYINDHELNSIISKIKKGHVQTTFDSRETIITSAAQEIQQTKENLTAPEILEAVYEVRLGTEFDDPTNPSVIKELYANCTAGGPLYEALKTKFGVRINVQTIFSLALMNTLGIKHAHFLEKDGNSVSPVPIVLPYELRMLLQESTHSQLSSPAKILNSIVRAANLFARGRYELTRRPKELTTSARYQIGAGPIEVLKIAAGPARSFLSGLARYFIPNSNDITTNSFLISSLSKSNKDVDLKPIRKSGDSLSFGSSKDSVYAEQGSAALSDFSNFGWRLILRSGTRNLVVEKFGELSTSRLEQLVAKSLEHDLKQIQEKLQQLLKATEDQTSQKTA